MDILFSSERLENECNNERLLVRCHGKERAKKLRRRLDDLRAAPTLEVMRSLPGRCHELKGNRAAELALDLDGPYRLIFEPANEPVPCLPNGGLDWAAITAVRIIGVEDYHG